MPAVVNASSAAALMARALFKIEHERNHIQMRGVNAFRKDALSGIGQFGALLVKHIAQAEIKLQFGHEFEKRQIDFAAHTYLQAGIERLRAQQRMFARSQIIKGRNAFRSMGRPM